MVVQDIRKDINKQLHFLLTIALKYKNKNRNTITGFYKLTDVKTI